VRRAWVVRVGETGKEIDALRAAELIGLPYDEIGDVRQLTGHLIEQAASRSRGPVAQTRSHLMRFAVDIRGGDLVVIPLASEREMWFTIVAGPYEHQPEPLVPHYVHVHTAEWLGWCDRGRPWLNNKLPYLDTPGTVVELRDPAWWFDQMATVELSQDHPDRYRRAAVAPAPAKSRSPRAPSTPRTPRAPKPAPAPKRPEMVLCAGQCGLQWRPAVLVDGLCPDCRGE
jgi:hypothetical protein